MTKNVQNDHYDRLGLTISKFWRVRENLTQDLDPRAKNLIKKTIVIYKIEDLVCVFRANDCILVEIIPTKNHPTKEIL
jgi:hypothetical protein